MGNLSHMRTRKSSVDNDGVSRRLRTLRVLKAGDSQTAFAAMMGIEVKRWNNFEHGSPLSKEVALILVRKVSGLTLDWLYLGKEDGLTTKLQRELSEAENGITDEQRRA
jgi:hypothetical protein